MKVSKQRNPSGQRKYQNWVRRMVYSSMIKLLVSGYLLLLNPIQCRIYGTYSTFDPLGPYTGNQTHKHSPTGLITHYSVNAHSHGQGQDSHSHGQESNRQGQESGNNQQQLPQKRQDYQQSNPPPVEAQPFTPPQHEDSNGLWMTSGQSGHFNGGQSGQQLQMYHEDPAIAKPFETNHAKNPTAAPLTSAASAASSSQTGSAASSSHTGSVGGGRMPLYLYNPSLARRLGISTFITGSVLYGLSLLPALLAVGVGSGVGPFAGRIF